MHQKFLGLAVLPLPQQSINCNDCVGLPVFKDPRPTGYSDAASELSSIVLYQDVVWDCRDEMRSDNTQTVRTGPAPGGHEQLILIVV